jgi:uncharacterized protein (TIGR02594 family)
MLKRIAIALALLATMLATPADARPRHHRHHHVHAHAQTVNAHANGSWVGSLFGSGGGSLVSTARAYLGTNPTGRASLWCADFMNMVVQRLGHRGTGSRLAVSFARWGRPAPRGCVGCVAVLHRRGGGHVGVVENYDARGNPVIVSGNHGHRVGEGVYSAGRVIAYRWP